MPHIIVEHSANLTASVQESGLLQKLHQVVTDSGLFAPEAVKARSIAFEQMVLPAGKQSFVHVTVSILEGRDDAKRSTLSDALFAATQNTLPHSDAYSVDIHEMDRQTYRK